MLVFPPPPLPETFKAIFVCVLMKMERREEELHLFKKKKSFVISMYIYEHDFWDMAISTR